MRQHIALPAAWAWRVVAYACLVVGLIGVVLPLLPTTPFVLLAAFAAAKGSPRLHAWLTDHRIFGPVIRDWSASRSVARRPKIAASVAMIVAAAFMVWVAPLIVTAVACTAMAAVATWLWLRPEPGR